MKKFMNNRENMVIESMKGYQSAHSDLIEICETPLYISRAHPSKTEKLALISGGGSGHEPLHIGMVGFGMLDAACPGQIFSSPTPQQILAASKCVHRGKGILFLVKNYAGDRMNFEMASELMNIEHATLTICDETVIASDVPDEQRRGLAGVVIYEKVLGAFAESGADLSSCLELGQDLHENIRTLGVAFTKATLPMGSGSTRFIPDGEMEIGMGLHGEPGRSCVAMANADSIVETLMNGICDDLALTPGSEILLFINGLGGTPAMEIYLLFTSAAKMCTKKGLKIKRSLVGSYATSIDTAGCSISVCRLNPQILSLWDAPVYTPVLRWGK